MPANPISMHVYFPLMYLVHPVASSDYRPLFPSEETLYRCMFAEEKKAKDVISLHRSAQTQKSHTIEKARLSQLRAWQSD